MLFTLRSSPSPQSRRAQQTKVSPVRGPPHVSAGLRAGRASAPSPGQQISRRAHWARHAPLARSRFSGGRSPIEAGRSPNKLKCRLGGPRRSLDRHRGSRLKRGLHNADEAFYSDNSIAGGLKVSALADTIGGVLPTDPSPVAEFESVWGFSMDRNYLRSRIGRATTRPTARTLSDAGTWPSTGRTRAAGNYPGDRLPTITPVTAHRR
jgi:hypothetical protein